MLSLRWLGNTGLRGVSGDGFDQIGRANFRGGGWIQRLGREADSRPGKETASPASVRRVIGKTGFGPVI